MNKRCPYYREDPGGMQWTAFLLTSAVVSSAVGHPAPPFSFQQQNPNWLKSLALKDVNGGTACAGCAVLLGLVGQLAEVHNSSVDKALETLCNFLPDQFGDLCRTAIETLGSDFIKLLEEKETSDIVCHALGLCRNDNGQYCHIFPLPKDASVETVSLRVKNARKRIGLTDPVQFRTRVIETISIKFCDFFKNLCKTFNDHVPYYDDDKDLFSAKGATFRGFDWRGKDCNDDDKDIYPGRRATTGDATADTNCNGIFGIDPATNSTYESQWCEGTQQMGVAVLGDSASAHFHIPPSYVTAATMNEHTFKDLLYILENEFDWPMLSSTTGYANISQWSGSISGPVDSLYFRMVELNRCNHRDFQNIAVNGARAYTMAKEIVKSLARRPDADKPLLLFLALIGNDVCNGHPSMEHMTKPDEMYSNTQETLEYLDQVLPSGSAVVITSMVDGRILYDNLSQRIHPLGSLHQDITYTNLYDYLNCLQVSPCFGWMNSNETWRNLTTQRAMQRNQALKEVVANFSSSKFKVHYLTTPFSEMLDEWVKQGHQPWEMIEPVDGFHPAQSGQALDAKIVFNILGKIEGLLPEPNPYNDKIKAKFGDQRGH